MLDKKIIASVSVVLIGLLLFWNSPTTDTSDTVEASEYEVSIIKSPTCSCCNGYVDELKKQGFQVNVIDTEDITPIKEKYQIPRDMQSCHTALIGDYYVEGHVPIEAVKKLLAEKPPIDGIAMPGMPPGSPGMPGTKSRPFEVYALSDGTPTLFFTG